jgi:hypothetical protein
MYLNAAWKPVGQDILEWLFPTLRTYPKTINVLVWDKTSAKRDYPHLLDQQASCPVIAEVVAILVPSRPPPPRHASPLPACYRCSSDRPRRYAHWPPACGRSLLYAPHGLRQPVCKCSDSMVVIFDKYVRQCWFSLTPLLSHKSLQRLAEPLLLLMIYLR